MERTLVRELRSNPGAHVTLQGWVERVRDLKSVQFVVLRDHTGVVQMVSVRGENPPLEETISRLTHESVVTATGIANENPSVKMGGVEVLLQDLKIESLAPQQLPIDVSGPIESDLDKRTDWRFLDLRRPENHLVFELQTRAEMAMREFWLQHGFLEIHSPKLMGSPSESGAELFSLPYFGRTAYLAQSPQFYKQMAIAAGFDRVFEIGPVFRANPSFTSKHDTEFTSVDVEMAWVESHEDVMRFEERWLQYVLAAVERDLGDQIARAAGRELVVPGVPFPRITMEEAIARLAELGHVPAPEVPGDLDSEGEQLLAKAMLDETGHEFFFLTDYPSSVRPFYHMRYEDRPAVTKSFDLLWRGLEITTGAQREHRYDVLVQQALEKGLTTEPIEFYLNFFRYGCPPHGGFGFGLTRMLMLILGRRNVREVTYVYRGPTRLTP